MATPDRIPPRLCDLVDPYIFEGKSSDQQRTISTGFGELDKLLCGGLQRKELAIFFGHPAVGKTSFALNLAINAATAEQSICFFSAEMSQEWIARRAMSILATVETRSLIMGNSNPHCRERLVQAQQQIEELPLYIDSTKTINLETISSKARAIREAAGLDLVIIDRLELINAQPLELRALAQELDITVVGLTNATSRNWPKRRHLESADTVIRLRQETLEITEEEFAKQYPTKPYPVGIVDLLLFKNRLGPLSSLSLIYFEKIGKFENLCLSGSFTDSP